jgi:cyclic pyranopterin phosphate synthase
MDTMVSEKFRYISRRDHLADVRKAIFKALELGLEPVKINTVVIRGFNDDELLDLRILPLIFRCTSGSLNSCRLEICYSGKRTA